MIPPTKAALARVIDEAARKSLPWPDNLSVIDWDNPDDEGRAQTLEEFVAGTYIDPAPEVFVAASKAAATAILALMEGWREESVERVARAIIVANNPGRDMRLNPVYAEELANASVCARAALAAMAPPEAVPIEGET